MGITNQSADQIRTRRRSTDLRAMVVEAAEYSFSQLGYKGATMAGIAARAGVTRSVLTRHFATKAELFTEVMTKPLLQFIDEWTRRWTDRLDGQPTEPELVYEFVSDLYRNSRAHVGALRLLMFSDEHLEPAVRQQVWQNLNHGLGAVLDIAHREIGSHGYPTRDVDVTVRAIISMVLGYVTLDPALLRTATSDEDHVVTHLASLILYGLALRPGELRDNIVP
ncbi:TetR/AcrR family transcriptional regulator [Mycobacterium sp.]|uniref:TetR/AcrR family transcriptional regulator n=1 Tax=Mycobacterium sp. TaxID=1785 RepID=UPI0025EA3BEF|nr:TetR/AcrR family transcriptional regulator [Mycobacterium sp.]